MSDNFENKLKANELRKKGDIEAALPLYKEIWEDTGDKYALAGLLFCYRKQKNFDEAIPLAEIAYSRFSDFDWCRNEYIWTLIQGKVYTFPDDGQLSELMSIVKKILEVKPDEIAFKITVFKLLKTAKKQNNWDILNEWILKIDPKILDGYTDESTGWTDKELWYYYRVNGLIYSHQEEEAIDIIENNHKEFYKQKKFFNRLKAKALINLKKYLEAEDSYKELTFKYKEWWLIHEYGNILLQNNKKDEALNKLIEAAQAPPMKPNLKVSLYSDIGNLLIQLNKKEQALPHLLLSKAIREEEGWGLGDLNDRIANLDLEIKQNIEVKSLIGECKSIWHELSGKNQAKTDSIQTTNLKGKITNLINEKAFCFIKTKNGQSYFCSKDDLPVGVINEQIVNFDLKPSFDKKKNKK
ncbi:MAG TPA: tetratricopeptide repeat protein [Ignavibacteriaceae bacterium]|nr:tetratricopeptide repeat protein [Ignavibacteriaceae bacterium]